MKESDPIKKVRQLSWLMVLYYVLYVAALIFFALAVQAESKALYVALAILCGVGATALNFYVTTSRAKLNAKLKAEYEAAGINPDELAKKNRKKRRK